MAKTSGELEKEFIDSAKEKTGNSIFEWLKIVKNSGIEKRNDLLEWLKKGHGLNHMQAQFIIGMHFNNGNPVYVDENVLLENQFIKCPDIRPLFDAISEKIVSNFQGTTLIPKKTYLSFTAVKEFAAINVKPGEIRLGMDLGDRPFDEKIQKTKMTGPMPRISHMAIIHDINEFDNIVFDLIKLSYERNHKK